MLANFNAHGTAALPAILQNSGRDYVDPLREAARRHRRPVRLLTPEGTQKFIQRIIQQSGVDPALVTWALTDAGAPGLAYGAGRNLTLLACPTGHLLSLDDDMSSVARSTARSSHWLVNAAGMWTSKSNLMPPPPPMPAPGELGPDFVQDGAAWLGLNAGSCLAGNKATWQLEQCPGLTHLLDPRSRISAGLSRNRGRWRCTQQADFFAQ